jgi:hypothetical protein
MRHRVHGRRERERAAGWSVSTRTRGDVFWSASSNQFVDGQDGGRDVWQHAIGRGAVDDARSRCADGSFLHDAEGLAMRFSRRVFGQDPNGRDDGDAVTAVRVVGLGGHKPSAVARRGGRAQMRSRGRAASSRREELLTSSSSTRRTKAR